MMSTEGHPRPTASLCRHLGAPSKDVTASRWHARPCSAGLQPPPSPVVPPLPLQHQAITGGIGNSPDQPRCEPLRAYSSTHLHIRSPIPRTTMVARQEQAPPHRSRHSGADGITLFATRNQTLSLTTTTVLYKGPAVTSRGFPQIRFLFVFLFASS